MGKSKRKRRESSVDSTSTDSSFSDDYERRSRRRTKRNRGHKHSHKRQGKKRAHSERRRHRSLSRNVNRGSTKTPPLTSPIRLNRLNIPIAVNDQTDLCLSNNNSATNNVTRLNIPNSMPAPVTPNFWAQNNFPVAFSVVPEFDPSENSQTIENWINKVNECAQIYSWNDRQICHYALPKLSGLAKKWYQGLSSVLYNWDEWTQKLKLAFPSNENYGDLLTTMLKLRCRFGQPLEHYYYDKIALINKCEITGKKAVGCLIHGIDDKFVRMGAGACMFEEPEQVLNYLRTVSQHETNTPSINNRNRNGYQQSRQVNKVANEQIKGNNSTDTVRCFNCNEMGHISLKCNKPIKRCNFCLKLGHETKDCRKNSNNTGEANKNNSSTERTKSVMRITNSESDNAKFYKDVKVGDITLRGYVDLGSKCTLIRESDAKLLHDTWATDNLPILQGFGNSSVKPIGKVVVTLQIGAVKAETEILVVENHYLKTSILVGQSFTEKPNVILLKTNDDLVFIQTPDVINSDLKIKVYADSDYVIEPKTTMPIDVTTNSKYSEGLFVQYNLRTLPNNEYIVLPGIFQFNAGKGYLMLTNLSLNDLKITKGALLARGQQYHEINTEYVGITTETKEYEPLPLADVKISTIVTNDQKQKLFKLIEKYRDCFAMNLGELGKTNLAEMEINLTDNRPVVYNPYRVSQSEREYLNKIIEDLLSNGIIRESTSDYSSPVILVSKKNGDKRLCVDYRALNRKTLKDKYPLPRIEDQLDRLGGNQFFTSLDLTSGYYQVPMCENSKRYTAFATPDGLFEFERMPFGLANAPSVFQRIINSMLKGKQNLALAYMDDLLVTSQTIEEGLDKLERVFQLLRSAQLKLNIKKCDFFQTRINYLGYEISADGIRPGVAKIQAVIDFPIPKNVHEVRQFVGLTSYFRRFIHNFSVIAKPLTNLTKKNAVWCFDEPQIKAFNELKSKLTTRPVLALYDPQAELEIHTDASKIGIGAILMQRINLETFHPIAYYSRQTTSDESKLHSYELETLAVVCALIRFRVYVLGKTFKVVTDCAAIRSTMTKKDLIPRVARWYLTMQEYDFTVEHRDGAKMSHVDALSRNPSTSESKVVVDVVDVLAIDDDAWLSTVQEQDSEIQRIISILNDPDTKDIVDIHKNYTIKNDRLYRVVIDKNNEVNLKWVVPKSVRWQVVRMNHDDVGHFGFEKTYSRVNQIYWFKKMRRFIKKYCNSCLSCAHNKIPAGTKEGELHPIPKISKPFDTLHTDHCGPFPISKKKNCHILVIIDAFTKFIYIKPVKNTKSSTTIQVFTEYFSLFGVPRRIISDRGTSFTSKEFSNFINGRGIKHILNAVASPRANGQVERYNRTIVNAITAANHGKPENEWDLCLPQIQWSLNNTINKSTNRTPSEMLFGVQTTGVSDGIMNPIVSDSHSTLDRVKIRSDAESRIQINQQKQKERFDRSHKKPTQYKLGDLVRVERDIRSDPGQSRKLLPKCVGPFRISKIIGNDRYEIEDTPITRKEGCRPYRSVFAVDRLHPWLAFNDAMTSDSE